ncbi:MAG: hypothetical protein QG657_3558, partial [Acidobacteriota bacterium]|nr:hypothetical protein [Acidobacteriota bacterium]
GLIYQALHIFGFDESNPYVAAAFS